jgi:hypothetical protein
MNIRKLFGVICTGVRIVLDVAVTGANGNAGLLDGLLGIMLCEQKPTATPEKK